MKSQYDYEIIRDYLHGLTDSKTSLEVAALIKQDEIARSIAEGILQLDDEFKDSDQDIESYLNKFHQSQADTIRQHTQPARVTQKLWFKIAASLLILVCAGSVVGIFLSRSDINSVIAMELSEPYPVSNLVRSDRSQTTEDRAYESYTSGNYSQAAQYFTQASGDVKDVASATFYHAMSHLYAGNYLNAIQLFETSVISDSRYVEQARWYRSLALLRANNNTKAAELLGEIRENPRHFKYEAAGELLSHLE